VYNAAMKLFAILACAVTCAAADLRVGIIGTDTSHVSVFSRIFNDPSGRDHVPGARVVAAYKGGSPDVESSRTRVDKYAEELRTKWQVELVPEISGLCGKVDAILLESVDGRAHLPQMREAVKCGKPIFIDKPLASTLKDAREIAKLAKEAGVPWFSTSSLRYNDVALKMKFEDSTGAMTWGPGHTEEHHELDLSWYAIHPIELLYALMGTGCEEVTRISTEKADVVVGRWKGGRTGTVRANRTSGGYGAVVFRPDGIVQSPPKFPSSYVPMLRHIVEFFKSGKPPLPNEETLEIFAFMDAAQRSKAAGGKPIKLR
jgi:hypothetical protein